MPVPDKTYSALCYAFWIVLSALKGRQPKS
jgi:hypothetical protein